jgi:hypothetical protein
LGKFELINQSSNESRNPSINQPTCEELLRVRAEGEGANGHGVTLQRVLHLLRLQESGFKGTVSGIVVGPDPHPKCGSRMQKVKKYRVLKCWMFSFEG